ncbi:MAG TPA: hypothetical protein VHL52_00420 [Acidimicrobiia bacterium]|nr:hypothetical protein [Acidimicrobiia bacterium]
MPDHDETEILTDEQIEEGPAGLDEQSWRARLATAQTRQDLLAGVRERWLEEDLSHLDESLDDPDELVSAISEATGLSREAVEDELDALG